MNRRHILKAALAGPVVALAAPPQSQGVIFRKLAGNQKVTLPPWRFDIHARRPRN